MSVILSLQLFLKLHWDSPSVTPVCFCCNPQLQIVTCIMNTVVQAPEKAEEATKQGLAEYAYIVTEEYVLSVMKELLEKKDLSRYVL